MTQEDIKHKVTSILSADEVVAAFQAQSVLFEKFISMARSPDEPEVIKAMLRETIDTSVELTGAAPLPTPLAGEPFAERPPRPSEPPCRMRSTSFRSRVPLRLRAWP